MVALRSERRGSDPGPPQEAGQVFEMNIPKEVQEIPGIRRGKGARNGTRKCSHS
jgi:hypothetical protein